MVPGCHPRTGAPGVRSAAADASPQQHFAAVIRSPVRSGLATLARRSIAGIGSLRQAPWQAATSRSTARDGNGASLACLAALRHERDMPCPSFAVRQQQREYDARCRRRGWRGRHVRQALGAGRVGCGSAAAGQIVRGMAPLMLGQSWCRAGAKRVRSRRVRGMRRKLLLKPSNLPFDQLAAGFPGTSRTTADQRPPGPQSFFRKPSIRSRVCRCWRGYQGRLCGWSGIMTNLAGTTSFTAS